MADTDLLREAKELLGEDGVLHEAQDLSLYEYDGGVDKARPELVAFPASTHHVAALVRLAKKHGTTVVGRGAGTGLSGGAIPRAGGMVISFARMKRIVEVDLKNERAVLQPGVVNLDISLAVGGDGYFYAPDPRARRPARSEGTFPRTRAGRTRWPTG